MNKELANKVLDETVAFYGEDFTRRGTIEDKHGNCVYKSPEGKMCAIGRCMTPKALNFYAEATISAEEIGKGETLREVEPVKSLDEALRKEYRGLSVRFWKLLQSLHDGHSNWNEKGLTLRGQTKVEYIQGVINERV